MTTRRATERAEALGREETIQELLRSGLRDRDYENLPTGERLRAFAASAAGVPAAPEALAGAKLIVCDCADVESGLEVNRFLLREHAGEIVAGALVAAFITSTPRVHMHVGAGDAEGAAALEAAIAEVRAGVAKGADTPADADVQVFHSPFRQNLKGYEESPTLVLTGETLLDLTHVLADGAEAFRAIGTSASTGTKFFQLSGAVKRPGIYELPLGMSLRRVIDDAGGGLKEGERVQAIIVGGAKGGCCRPDELDLPLDFEAVRQMGGVIGTGGVAVLTEKDCIVDHVNNAIAASCYENCGKCALGREGSYQLREIVADMTSGKSRSSDLDMIREISRAMQLACACPAGKMAPNIILSTLEKFPEEYDAHTRRKKCDALVCKKYVTFHILPELCDGCGACAAECPEDAIEGGKKKIHVIDQDSCEKCGKCLEVCDGLRKAVVKAGIIKPKTPKRPIPVGSWNG
jgi:NADH:ubiquinone oxidoreductase subunit F (NADH-binding)/Pyruvate/2-oxoacid:ferredoxin oxidoreductase delta subunit